MKKNIWALGCFFFLSSSLLSQVVTTDPVFPTENEAVRIIFNAAEGNAGLSDYTGDIYAHTGVITSKSTTLTDWKYVIAEWNVDTGKAKLTSLGNNLWELMISPDIRSFYQVPEGEQILKMAFVFRNSGASRTGRMEDGSDIFAEVYPAGLNVTFQQPSQQLVVKHQGEILEIVVDAIQSDSVLLFQNNQLLVAAKGTAIDTALIMNEIGQFDFRTEARKGTDWVSDEFTCLVIGEIPMEPLPSGWIDGINYPDDETAGLVLYAPGKEYVLVIGGFNNWVPGIDYLMKKTPDGDRFWLKIKNLEPGHEYIFQYWIDGDLKVADPYCEKTSDPWNDRYINSETYPDLISYPQGLTINVASVLQPGQKDYTWKNNDFVAPKPEKLVIYELLVRDFVARHDFSTITDTLNYLQGLGVNAIELMPVSEFEGNESWGYNPSFYFAPDKYYGPKNSFKTLIDSLHGRGMAVIMDVVLNHSYGQSPLVQLYWDAANNRPAANNPWYNPQSPNPVYAWGYDFNHESDATRRFVDSVNSYWIQHFKIDGFRYDFSKGFTNTPGDGGAYDPARISILKRMADQVRKINPDMYLILEHFAANQEEIELSNYGFLLWGNSNYAYRMATQGWLSGSNDDFSSVSYLHRGWSKPHLVGYMESHDEERLMYECLRFGNNQNPDSPVKTIEGALRRMELGANLFIPVPGPKMIWMFGELGYDYSINYNGRIGNKPIRWDYYDESLRRRLYQVYGALNRLKQQHEVFSTADFSADLSDTVKTIHLNSDQMNVTILGNFWVRPVSRNPNFQHAGWWYEYWTGDSTFITNTSAPLSLAPGEYRLYTDVRLVTPEIISGTDPTHSYNRQPDDDLEIFPNPAGEFCFIRIPDWHESGRIVIRSVTGQVIQQSYSASTDPGSWIRIDLPFNGSGIYFIEFQGKNEGSLHQYFGRLIRYQ